MVRVLRDGEESVEGGSGREKCMGRAENSEETGSDRMGISLGRSV